jgi:hypothetical protein
MQRSYRTPKGTDLPLLNLRGKEYLEVKYRLVWFREDHPDWAIETELLSVTDDSAYARAAIKDAQGRIIATSHKFETKKGFPDFIEKAETGSIGRALALIGYGTQFCADELDEGERIVDSPVERREPVAAMTYNDARSASKPATKPAAASKSTASASVSPVAVSVVPAAAPAEASAPETFKVASGAKDPGDYTIGFGKKYKGLKLRDIPRNELEGYIEWLEDNAAKKGLPLSEEARFLKVAVGRFFGASNSGASQVAQGPQMAEARGH